MVAYFFIPMDYDNIHMTCFFSTYPFVNSPDICDCTSSSCGGQKSIGLILQLLGSAAES